MRSIKWDKSLWLEGADSNLLNGLQWKPNIVSFVGDQSRRLQSAGNHSLKIAHTADANTPGGRATSLKNRELLRIALA